MSQQQPAAVDNNNDSFEIISKTTPIPPPADEFPPLGLGNPTDSKNLGAPAAEEGEHDEFFLLYLAAENEDGLDSKMKPLVKKFPSGSTRTIFTAQQVKVLEERFNSGKKYLSAAERSDLAKLIDIWFKNHRFKEKVAQRESNGNTTSNSGTQNPWEWFKDKNAGNGSTSNGTQTHPDQHQKASEPKWFKDPSFLVIFVIAVLIVLLAAFLAIAYTANANFERMRRENEKNVAKLHEFQQMYNKDTEDLKKVFDVEFAKIFEMLRERQLMALNHKSNHTSDAQKDAGSFCNVIRSQDLPKDGSTGKNGIPAGKMEQMQKLLEKWFEDPFYNGVYVGAMFVGLLAALLAKAYGWKNKQYVAHLLEQNKQHVAHLLEQNKQHVAHLMEQHNQYVAHLLEHQNAKIVLTNNSKNCWDISPSDGLTVRGNTVTCNGPEEYSVEKCSSVRVKQGFPTVLDDNNKNAQLGYTINYAEFKIVYDCAKRTHYEKEFDQEDDTLGGNAADGMDATKLFGKGDTIGCGVLLIHKSATAKWAKCARCEQHRAWVFFTKNGNILDDPQPLPVDGPSHLYPTIVFRGHLEQEKVTANFGQKPFLFAIPPAIGLFAEPSGQNCEEKPQKPVF